MKSVLIPVLILSVLMLGAKPDNSTEAEKSAEIPEAQTVRTVKMYYYLSNPNIYINEKTGKAEGAFYDYMQVMAAEMGVLIDWNTEYTPIPRMITILEQTPDTAIFGLSKTAERAEIMNYSETPYLLDKPCLVVLKDSKLKEINRIEDILGLTIGYASNAYLPAFMKDSRIRFDFISSPGYHKVNLQKLMANRFDAVFSPVTNPILVYINELNIKNKVRLLPLPEKPSAYYVIFAKKSPDLAKKYDSVFKKLNGQKLYQQKLAKYIN